VTASIKTPKATYALGKISVKAGKAKLPPITFKSSGKFELRIKIGSLVRVFKVTSR